jgi:hypothetical protein
MPIGRQYCKFNEIHLSIMRYSIKIGGLSRSLSSTSCMAAPGLVSLIIALCLTAAPAGAHSPSDLSLAYNQTGGELTVTITHEVADPATHYIKEVQISIDGKTVRTILYARQPFATTFSYTYPLQVQAGSSIDVNAPCVLGGSIRRTLFIPGSAGSPPNQSGTPASPTKAAAGIVPVLGLAFLLLWRRER